MPPGTLSDADRALLERLLANEADMAFRRRAFVLLDYLELADDLDVLDCGCGMGFYLMVMGRLRDLRLTGVDSDPARLRLAREHGVSATLLTGDARALPFAKDSFDRVLMSEMLEHVPDDLAVVREAHRVLRRGGILAISVPHARYPFWWDPINATWIALGGPPIRSGPVAGIWSNHERLYEPARLVALVQGAGFEVDDCVEATHYSVPFIHFLVYGIGKPLLEKEILPRRLRKSADRFSGLENRGSLANPFNAARYMFRLVDRLNDRPDVAHKRTFVNVLLKARKR
jgi:SAM-dependent methyltransferase